jgi:RNA polymerase sigma factor (TIGR02999 family)
MQSHDQDDDGDDLFATVYRQLHAIARGMLRGERRDHTLQPTALLHEAWLRVSGNGRAPDDRAAFLRVAAAAMRRVLVDHARRRRRHKRGGGQVGITLTPDLLGADAAAASVLVVDDALARLAAVDPALAELVELRVFADLPLPDVAEVLGTSLRSTERQWRLARAFLRTALGDDRER